MGRSPSSRVIFKKCWRWAPIATKLGCGRNDTRAVHKWTPPSCQAYADINQITLSNVSQLKPAWTFTTPSGSEAVQPDATPLVVDGVMYIPGTAGGVFALNATTGKQVWHYTVAN